MSAEIANAAAKAREASRVLATTSAATRDAALEAIAAALEAEAPALLEANTRDIAAAAAMVERGEIGAPLLKRLDLGRKYDSVVGMVRSVRSLADPLEHTQTATELADGLDLYRISVPIGVLGVIFESRPDALVQIAALCLKSGNAVLMKGGREASESNRALAEVIARASATVPGIPDGWLVLLETREDVAAILGLHEHIDLIIPRGSNEFVRYIMDNTNIPVMGHADGICHVYVDEAADAAKALRVAIDSKVQYVAVCNATETLLVHTKIADSFLAEAIPALREAGVEIRGDARAKAIGGDAVLVATDEDWATEYLDYILSIRVVDSMDEAITHINRYGSHHTDSICTENAGSALRFLRAVDSASVAHNASTRFADGFRYGLGAEVGVSTNRLHSRGPVGLEGLTTYKYLLLGDGHTVDDFEGASPQPYSHRSLDQAWTPPSS
jgi:glutamate-5-semialdehyde dehydrogenase